MAEDCIFCKIAAGDIPADVVYQDDRITAFRDTNPQAPIHILIVPNRHVRDVTALSSSDAELMGHMVNVATQVGEDEGLGTPDRGYRLVVNYGSQGGLAVPHLHLHLLGGREMGWPPG